MNMKTKASNPEEYIDRLTGWTRDCVQHLRNHVRSASDLDEEIKWGHLVYSSNGPAILIRAEKDRVLFGFWRGKRLREIEPKLQAGGKYKMATIEIHSEPYPKRKSDKRIGSRSYEVKRRTGQSTRRSKEMITRNLPINVSVTDYARFNKRYLAFIIYV